MSKDSNDFWKYLLGAGVAYGAWKLYEHYQSNDPDALERHAYKILQKDINTFSTDAIREQELAQAMLAKAKILREHREMERQGLPIDKDMQAATLKLSEINYTGGYGQATNDQIADAVGTLYQSAKRTATDLGHKIFPNQNRCPTCSGQGWQICSACHGIGKNRSVPYPNLTGNQFTDALIMQRYQADSLCPVCKGAENCR